MRVENGIVSPSINLFIRNIHRHRTTMMISWQSVILELDIGSPIRSHHADEDKDEQQDEDDEMAWKRFRPSVLRTVCQSMYIRILISLLSAVILSLFYIMISYISSEPMRNWQFHPKETPPVKIQWIRELPDVIGVAFLYMWFFAGMLFLFDRIS